MTLAIFLVVSPTLAAWAAYWSLGLWGLESNRASRIVCVFCPFMIAGILAFPAYLFLGTEGVDTQTFGALQQIQIKAIFFAIAIALLIPTVLIAILAGKRFDKRTQMKSY
jgi:hypothetical protein